MTDGTAPTGFPRGIGAPATRALNAAGYTHLAQLSGVPVDELKALHGMGPKALRVLGEALAERGLALGGPS
ncbi:DNA-binding protein [Streptomyces antnestii]|uniref:DNA-binding protein n=1 Tax=Streptomyces antnestii TaxID=2494256 RepID=A0A437PKG9_9ACTN|nr:DNA-binding protein [Streptomyces sp. San01]RVU22776.1 DNA-binding protein [Streptomyces sp. San01]